MEASTTATLPPLTAEFLKHHPELSHEESGEGLPERVLQFGAGVFLRGFVDWMIDGMNRKGLFRGRVVVVTSMNPATRDAEAARRSVYTFCAGHRERSAGRRKTYCQCDQSRY